VSVGCEWLGTWIGVGSSLDRWNACCSDEKL